MSAPLFLGLDHVIRLHRSLIESYGGLDGVRDVGMLHSPSSSAHGGNEPPPKLARLLSRHRRSARTARLWLSGLA